MRKIISLICLLLPALAVAETLAVDTGMRQDVRPDAPDRYTVTKGDTLWDISGKFFKDPWKWPHIWGLNKETIKNPHWIYPGDIVMLDRTTGTLQIGAPVPATGTSATGEAQPPASAAGETAETGTFKLAPRIREERGLHDAIPSIPASAITPFLAQPLVIEEDALKLAPTLLGAREGRVILGEDDITFAKGLTPDKGTQWQIYRPGKTFVDPDTKEVLGIEAVYLGSAEVTSFGDISTLKIKDAKLEISAGDRLAAPVAEDVSNYLPRAPDSKISAQVISIYGGVNQGGQNSVITLNKGARDGLENGHVLALYREGEVIRHGGKKYTLPEERYGLVFVFRVFNKVSYALVMQTKLPVQLLDHANTP